MASAYMPRMDEMALDARVLLFAAGAVMVSGVMFGLVPVLRLSATEANEAIREGGRGTASARVHRSQSVLVLAQCALALVLLTGAGLLLKSLERLQSVNPGFDPRQVLVMRLEFPSAPPPTAEQRTQTSVTESGAARAREQMLAALDARLQSIPGVEAVGFVDDMFIAGEGNKSITIPGRTMDQVSAGELNDGAVTPGFFRVMRVPLRRGRYPTRYDAEQKIRALWSLVVTDLSLAEKERRAIPEPVVVNEAFARRFFAGDDPLGKRFCIDPTNKTYWYEIVGVVGDMHRQGLDRAAIPEYYGPYIPSPNGRVDLLARTTPEPLALAATVRGEVVRALPSIVVASVSTAETQLGDFSSQRRLETWLLTSFAALAVALAAIGIFGLAQYRVAERTREIGVRIALGATPSDVARLVIAQGMRMPLAGIALGLLASAGLTRLIAHQLFDVAPQDPITHASVAALLVLVSAIACYLPARRAAQADPVRALRG
jgi:predicted permease